MDFKTLHHWIYRLESERLTWKDQLKLADDIHRAVIFYNQVLGQGAPTLPLLFHMAHEYMEEIEELKQTIQNLTQELEKKYR